MEILVLRIFLTFKVMASHGYFTELYPYINYINSSSMFAFISSYFAYKFFINPSLKDLYARIKPDLILTIPMVAFNYYNTHKAFSFVQNNVIYWFVYQWLVFLIIVYGIGKIRINQNLKLTLLFPVLYFFSFNLHLIYGSGGQHVANNPIHNAQWFFLGLFVACLTKGVTLSTPINNKALKWLNKWGLRIVFYYHVPIHILFIAN